MGPKLIPNLLQVDLATTELPRRNLAKMLNSARDYPLLAPPGISFIAVLIAVLMCSARTSNQDW